MVPTVFLPAITSAPEVLQHHMRPHVHAAYRYVAWSPAHHGSALCTSLYRPHCLAHMLLGLQSVSICFQSRNGQARQVVVEVFHDTDFL